MTEISFWFSRATLLPKSPAVTARKAMVILSDDQVAASGVFRWPKNRRVQESLPKLLRRVIR